MIEQMFEQIDIDHKVNKKKTGSPSQLKASTLQGEINYQELLMAYADMKISSRQERLYRAFHHMQKHEPNKDRITVEDILDIVKGYK